jgi:hypothetical protein
LLLFAELAEFGCARRYDQTMHSAGLSPPIKAVALLGNLHIRHPWVEHGVREESDCFAQPGYLLLSLHLKKFVHDDAEYLY